MNALEVLTRLGRENLVEQIHEALLGVSAEVVSTGKPGAVTVTLKVSHPRGSDPTVVVVDEEVKRTLPKTDAQGAMFFAIEGELHGRDPRQAELPTFRLVNEETGEFRDVQPGEAMREAGE